MIKLNLKNAVGKEKILDYQKEVEKINEMIKKRRA